MATQKGRNWSSGDIVTAANLSSIERGVSAVAEEYTPTTWANGNTVTAAALNNIEQGIANAGGGGGSSDFSTAEVTAVVDRGISSSDLPYIPIAYEAEDYAPATLMVGEMQDGTYNIPLYKGEFDMELSSSLSAVCTGSAVYESGWIFITGDCTITIIGSDGDGDIE